MKIEMMVNGSAAQSWDIPENDIPMEITWEWELQARYEYRKAIIDRWILSMRRAYSDLLQRMGDKVCFRISLGSRVNNIEFSDEEMNEFESLIIKNTKHDLS
jgi:hypothetical protein